MIIAPEVMSSRWQAEIKTEWQFGFMGFRPHHTIVYSAVFTKPDDETSAHNEWLRSTEQESPDA
jgi:hypothetical protein